MNSTKQGQGQSAFCWFYAARAERDSEAQAHLEELNKNISKTEFISFKTAGDALVDEIKFIYNNRNK